MMFDTAPGATDLWAPVGASVDLCGAQALLGEAHEVCNNRQFASTHL